MGCAKTKQHQIKLQSIERTPSARRAPHTHTYKIILGESRRNAQIVCKLQSLGLNFIMMRRARLGAPAGSKWLKLCAKFCTPAVARASVRVPTMRCRFWCRGWWSVTEGLVLSVLVRATVSQSLANINACRHKSWQRRYEFRHRHQRHPLSPPGRRRRRRRRV